MKQLLVAPVLLLSVLLASGCGTEPATSSGGDIAIIDGEQQQADGSEVSTGTDATPDTATGDTDGPAETDIAAPDVVDATDIGSATDIEVDPQSDASVVETDVETSEIDSLAPGTDAVIDVVPAGTDVGTDTSETDIAAGTDVWAVTDIVASDVAETDIAETDAATTDAAMTDSVEADVPDTAPAETDTATQTDSAAVTDAIATDALASDTATGTDAEATDIEALTDASAGETDISQTSDTAAETDVAAESDAQANDDGLAAGTDVATDPCLAMNCDDGDSCTADSCDNGACIHSPVAGCEQACLNTADCPEGVCHPSLYYCVACNSNSDCGAGERCLANTCVEAIACTGDSGCKASNQVCDLGAGFCVDCLGNPDCGGGAICKQNQCQGLTACTSSKQCPGTEVCNTTAGYCVQCVLDGDCPADQFCADGGVCQLDACLTGACVNGYHATCNANGSGFFKPLTCSDNNGCTTDLCSPQDGCSSVPNSDPCNDNNACTIVDVCSAGTCQGTTPVECVALSQCHDTGTCNPLSGICSEPLKADKAVCDDGNACTTGDACKTGQCKATGLTDCTDIDPDSTEACDPLKGCYYVWAEVCNDQDDNQDGVTDNVVCGGSPCECTDEGMVCSTACTVCPDPGDLAMTINDMGVQKVVCAHDYPAWGIPPTDGSQFVDNGDYTTSDTVTGLQWPQLLDGTARKWADGKTYCDNLVLAGHGDWRMPTLFELTTVMDLGKASGLVSQIYQPGGYVWTATSLEQWPDRAFYGPGIVYIPKTYYDLPPMCVRTEKLVQGVVNRWAKNGTFAKTDKATGLMWSRFPNPQKVPYASADSICQNLVDGGFEDWRLPTAHEGASVIDTGVFVMPAATPVVWTGVFWTSTAAWNGSGPAQKVTIDIGTGATSTYPFMGGSALDSTKYMPACVRSGQ